ncbi:MAG: YdjY domain-containing protein [Luteolibacter sp.]
MGFLRTLPVLLLLPLAAAGQDRPEAAAAPASSEPGKAAIERIDGTRYKLGEITFDQKSREIRFPAKVNMTEGLLEYLVVHSRGKVHESLFATDTSPTRLNVVFKLLRYRPSAELYATDSPAEHEAGTKFPDVAAEVKTDARVDLKVEWTDDTGKTRTVPVNEWISHAVTERQMPSDPWVYGGSEVSNGRYQAEATGDIVAIFLSSSAILNYPGKDNNDDEAWLPFPKRVPPVGTKVVLIVTPHQGAKPATTP